MVAEETETGKLCVISNMTTPRLILPPSEHLQTIVEKTSDVEQPDIEVPITDVESIQLSSTVCLEPTIIYGPKTDADMKKIVVLATDLEPTGYLLFFSQPMWNSKFL